MQLTCPNCGEQISSENINIQHMTAVCPECSTVFRFDPPDAKAKRRKVKQPTHVTVQEADHQLHLSFRTNFRLDKNEAFISTSIMSLVFTLLTIFTLVGYFASDAPLILSLGFGLVASILYYLLALITYNKTHIKIDNKAIQVSRKPIPALFTPPRAIRLSGIERIQYTETPVSRREDYDTPRYNVWAEMIDGRRKVIVSELVDDYAVFIAQRINEYLDLAMPPDVSRLIDDEHAPEEDQIHNETISHTEIDNH